MRRREFITLLGGAAAGWPLRIEAQQPAASMLIGILSGGGSGSFDPFAASFRQGIGDAGVDPRTVAFEARWAQGQFDRLPGLAAELAARQPALIATITLPGALAAKSATDRIPVVFVVGEDPVKAGLVASMSRPGGNVTGMTNFMNVLGAKRLELVSEAVPGAVMIALLVNPNNPNSEPDIRDLQTAAVALGRRVLVQHAGSAAEIETAFMAVAAQGAGALFVNIDPFLFAQREQIAMLAARHRIPTIHPFRDYATGGGLMSYGASFAGAWRQAGLYAGRIIKGAKPADLPVLQPTKFELVINLKAARTLSLELPATLLARADEIIE
jgi:putative ABC transport system substrate-binding protein